MEDVPHQRKLRVIRAHLNCSQQEFAKRVGISFATVRNWEQDSRGSPTPAAMALIDIIYANPDMALKMLDQTRNIE